MKRILTPVLGFLALAAVACSSATNPERGATPTPVSTPTPGPLSRANPNIVEETETYVIERLPKKDYIRVDDRHIRHPLIDAPVEFLREDEDYYYVASPKYVPGLSEHEAAVAAAAVPDVPKEPTKTEPAVPLSDFEDLSPPQISGRLKLEEVRLSGLPAGGMWRASFVIADMNGDKIPDIVAPPPRLGGGSGLQIWVGDGKGKFAKWPISLTEGGKPKRAFSLAYGGVAVGDIDGDGNLDVVAASHGGGLTSLFGDGKGTFEVVRTGLPGRQFSSQAIVLSDADGDGKPDIVASTDGMSGVENLPEGVDKQQVRVYLYRGTKGWEFKPDGLVGGLYSNCLHAWDFDGDGAKDVLTGSHYLGGPTLLWKNEKNGSFSYVYFPEVEISAVHFATVPGTFGRERSPAFGGAIQLHTNDPEPLSAFGITVYRFKDGAWSRHRVWRKKDAKTLLYALAMGDLDGDGLDDVVFADSEERRLRIFFQEADASFRELDAKQEPALDSPGQSIQLVDLDRDGRLDVVLSKAISSSNPGDKGGWSVFLNRR